MDPWLGVTCDSSEWTCGLPRSPCPAELNENSQVPDPAKGGGRVLPSERGPVASSSHTGMVQQADLAGVRTEGS